MTQQTRKEELRIDRRQIRAKLAQATEPLRSGTCEVHISGRRIADKAKELVHEGNVRRVSIRNRSGDTVMDIPLTLGLVGAAVRPGWAAIGTIAALLTNCTITVERPAE